MPALLVLIILVVANQFEHHILQPFFMGRVLRIAVPLTAVGWTIYRTLAGDRTTT